MDASSGSRGLVVAVIRTAVATDSTSSRSPRTSSSALWLRLPASLCVEVTTASAPAASASVGSPGWNGR